MRKCFFYCTKECLFFDTAYIRWNFFWRENKQRCYCSKKYFDRTNRRCLISESDLSSSHSISKLTSRSHGSADSCIEFRWPTRSGYGESLPGTTEKQLPNSSNLLHYAPADFLFACVSRNCPLFSSARTTHWDFWYTHCLLAAFRPSPAKLANIVANQNRRKRPADSGTYGP